MSRLLIASLLLVRRELRPRYIVQHLLAMTIRQKHPVFGGCIRKTGAPLDSGHHWVQILRALEVDTLLFTLKVKRVPVSTSLAPHLGHSAVAIGFGPQ